MGVALLEQFYLHLNSEMDRIQGSRVTVLLTAWKLREPMQRMLSGGGQHFEQVVHLPTPSLEQRIDILRVLTARIQVDELNLEELARAAPDGSSGCDLASYV